MPAKPAETGHWLHLAQPSQHSMSAATLIITACHALRCSLAALQAQTQLAPGSLPGSRLPACGTTTAARCCSYGPVFLVPGPHVRHRLPPGLRSLFDTGLAKTSGNTLTVHPEARQRVSVRSAAG